MEPNFRNQFKYYFSAKISQYSVQNTRRHRIHAASEAIEYVLFTNFYLWYCPNVPKVSYTDKWGAVTLVIADHLSILYILHIDLGPFIE